MDTEYIDDDDIGEIEDDDDDEFCGYDEDESEEDMFEFNSSGKVNETELKDFLYDLSKDPYEEKKFLLVERKDDATL